jgi:glycosyltransferase involved in cell wall biosynthesis
MPRSLKVLISAYACEPEKGSEPGVGWNWVQQIARFNEVWVITRGNNRYPIEKALYYKPLPQVHWIYFDLPASVRFWKKGQRGARAYYYLWQVGAYIIAKRLHATVDFDLVHHVTLVTHWLPSFMALLPIPFLWGPVGGGESSPKGFLQTYSRQGKLYECLRYIAQRIGEQDPFVRHTARHARRAFATTPETARRIEKLGCPSVTVLSQVAMSCEETVSLASFSVRQALPFRLVSIGRLLHWKGFHIGLHAFAMMHREFPSSEYYLIGDGPERGHLQDLAEHYGIALQVRLWGNLPRHQTLEKLRECDVLIHPSLHDSGGGVCLEAMAAGRPVICLNLGGPALQVTEETGLKLPAISPAQVITDLTRAMLRLARDPTLRIRMAEAGRQRVAEHFSWEKKGELIQQTYSEVLGKCL